RTSAVTMIACVAGNRSASYGRPPVLQGTSVVHGLIIAGVHQQIIFSSGFVRRRLHLPIQPQSQRNVTTELPYVLKVAVGGRNQRMREHWRAERIRLETAVARQQLRNAIQQAEKSGVEFVVPQDVCRSETVCRDTAATKRQPVSNWN